MNINVFRHGQLRSSTWHLMSHIYWRSEATWLSPNTHQQCPELTGKTKKSHWTVSSCPLFIYLFRSVFISRRDSWFRRGWSHTACCTFNLHIVYKMHVCKYSCKMKRYQIITLMWVNIYDVVVFPEFILIRKPGTSVSTRIQSFHSQNGWTDVLPGFFKCFQCWESEECRTRTSINLCAP